MKRKTFKIVFNLYSYSQLPVIEANYALNLEPAFLWE